MNILVNITIILIAVFLHNCGASQSNGIDEPLDPLSIKPDSAQLEEFDLNGTWVLTNYFDTIVQHRELAKYRLQEPSWFAILLEIEDDSILQCFGSIEHRTFAIDQHSDTIGILSPNISADQWTLSISGPYLKLTQGKSSQRPDATEYLFRKSNDFSEFTKQNKDFFVIGNNVTQYFNDKLFRGQYLNKNTRKKVVFGENGQLSGMDGYDTYEVRNYFGTLHMYHNLDVITFSNSQNNEYKQYNWVFSGNQLLLTEFVYETITEDGETFESDYLTLGSEKIELRRIDE